MFIDPVKMFPDIFTGRAAINGGSRAKTFVDKTIAYERASIWPLHKTVYIASRFRSVPNEQDFNISRIEKLRKKMKIWYPQLFSAERYYEDHTDLAPPPHLGELTVANITKSLKNTANFLCLAGHGTTLNSKYFTDECIAQLDRNRLFVVFGNSCHMANIGYYSTDTFVEKLIFKENGGGDRICRVCQSGC